MKKILVFIFLVTLSLSNNVIAQWSPHINLSPSAVSAGLNENAGPCMSVSGDTVNVVWSDHRASGGSIWFRQSLDEGQTWNNPMMISDSIWNTNFPAVAAFGNSIHVVWEDTSLGQNASFYRRSLDGGHTWLPIVVLDSVTKFWPGIATNGNMVVATLNKEMVVGNTEVFVMISNDNGATWGPEIQISHATNRSEDPAIFIAGNNIHLSWNDKRSGIMCIYYCRSNNGGLTWGPETPITSTDSYSSMVIQENNHVNICYGATVAGNFDVYLSESSDTGQSWSISQQLTSNPAGEVYPFLARSDSNLFLGYVQFGTGANYLHSADGGATWDTALFFGHGSNPFVAITGCTVPVLWQDSGHINFSKNPTANCFTDVKEFKVSSFMFHVYPNPAGEKLMVNGYSLSGKKEIKISIVDVLGKEIQTVTTANSFCELDISNLPSGIYFVEVKNDNYFGVNKFIKQ